MDSSCFKNNNNKTFPKQKQKPVQKCGDTREISVSWESQVVPCVWGWNEKTRSKGGCKW